MMILMITILIGAISLSTGEVTTNSWKQDPELFQLSSNIHCDFPVFNANDYPTFDDIPFLDIPFVIQNLTDDWPAHENWKKENLLKKYGNRYVRSGSEVSIVYSAGNSEFSSTLQDFITFFDQYTENHSFHSQKETEIIGDQFLFDTTILHAIPELRNDFKIPRLFQDWDVPEREQNYSIWHMLSIGPSRSGLSFHNHGQTWIAVIHGMKRWFVYPPGYGPPREIDQRFPPTLTIWEWFVDYYPQLLQLEKPGFIDSDKFEDGFRPLECLQREGDVLYLPSLWNHMTLNVGETIGVGAQEGLETDERLEISLEAYKKNPKNYEALKDIGISLYYKSLTELEQFRRNFNFTENNQIISLNSEDQLRNYFEFTGDSSIVIRYNDQHWIDEATLISKLLTVVDTSCDVILLRDSSIDSTQLTLQVFHGLDAPDWQKNGLCSVNASIIIDETHSLPPLSTLISFQVQGSLRTLPMKVGVEMEKSIFFFKKALEVKPFQPDSIQLISEVYGKLGQVDEVKKLIVAAEQRYDTIHQIYKISQKSLASLYYKLVLISENAGLPEDIMRLSMKCIDQDNSLIFCWKSYFQQVHLHLDNDQLQEFNEFHKRFRQMITKRFLITDLDELLPVVAQPQEILAFIDYIVQRYY